jgi:SAM-dependent methyltransferase
MKRTSNPNINFKSYWNSVYGNLQKREEYASQGSDKKQPQYISDTKRFITAVEKTKGERVLDIGCGVGVYTKMVKEKYPNTEVWGVDISDKAIEDNKLESPDIKYFQGYIGDLDFLPKEYFDTVFTGETLEHLDEPVALIKDAYKALKTGGRFILTTPLNDAIHSGEHVWFFTKEDVEKLFIDNGFSCEFIDLPDLEYKIVIFAVGEKI